MTCQTCGDPLSTSSSTCITCGTPIDAPPVTPGVKTFTVRGLGIAASVLVLLTVLADALSYTAPIVGRSLTSEPNDIDRALAAVFYEGLVAAVSLGALLAAGVLVIIWLYRAHRNLDAFPGSYPAMRHGWAIGGWLIPFANLVLPFRVMSDVVRGSLWRGRPMVLTGVWWAAFLVSTVGGNFLARRTGSLPLPETPDDVTAYADAYAGLIVPSLVVLAASAVAGVLLVVLIHRVSVAQEARIQRAGPGPLLPGQAFPAPPGQPYPAPPGQPYPAPPREPGEPAAPGGATIGS